MKTIAHNRYIFRLFLVSIKKSARSKPCALFMFIEIASEQTEVIVGKDDAVVGLSAPGITGGDDIGCVECDHLKGGALISILFHVLFLLWISRSDRSRLRKHLRIHRSCRSQCTDQPEGWSSCTWLPDNG